VYCGFLKLQSLLSRLELVELENVALILKSIRREIPMGQPIHSGGFATKGGGEI